MSHPKDGRLVCHDEVTACAVESGKTIILFTTIETEQNDDLGVPERENAIEVEGG